MLISVRNRRDLASAIALSFEERKVVYLDVENVFTCDRSQHDSATSGHEMKWRLVREKTLEDLTEDSYFFYN